VAVLQLQPIGPVLNQNDRPEQFRCVGTAIEDRTTERQIRSEYFAMTEIAIIGAGPYGLSIAAHFRGSGIPFRIFGRPMDSWLAHMPKGMSLKSDGFASNISDPDGALTLKKFCSECGIEYGDTGLPVRLDTFSAYGLTFRDRLVPELEEKMVVSVERANSGFRLRLDDGEVFTARRVVLAVGITHFEYIPGNLANLPAQFVSHSFRHPDPEKFCGRDVVVVGGGSSAIDLAAELHDSGAQVQLVVRKRSLKFHGKPEIGKRRPLWQRIRHPQSGLGSGLRSSFFSKAPMLFRYFPKSLRLEIVRRHLGPSAPWFTRERVMGRVPIHLGCTPERAEVRDPKVHLFVRMADGSQREIVTDHVIAATGYKVDLNRLTFLSDDIRSTINVLERTPVLASNFESSIPGLYFVGISAANSFGPLMRFAFGADFAARHITQRLRKSLARELAVPASGVVAATK
jgi:cation diffusion facilitator CzcD-associated flavoprotein CzcO